MAIGSAVMRLCSWKAFLVYLTWATMVWFHVLGGGVKEPTCLHTAAPSVLYCPSFPRKKEPVTRNYA